MTKKHHAETDRSAVGAEPDPHAPAPPPETPPPTNPAQGSVGVGTQGTPPAANLEAKQGTTGTEAEDLEAVKRLAAAGEPLVDLNKAPADRASEQAAHELKGKGEGNPKPETVQPRTYRAYVPDDQIKARAIGSQVYYRSGAPHQDGHGGTNLHAAIITDLHDDWSADLTVFPKRAGMYHIECAPLHRGSGWDPNEISMGCYRPRE